MLIVHKTLENTKNISVRQSEMTATSICNTDMYPGVTTYCNGVASFTT